MLWFMISNFEKSGLTISAHEKSYARTSIMESRASWVLCISGCFSVCLILGSRTPGSSKAMGNLQQGFFTFFKKEKKKSKNLSKIVTMGIGEQAEGLCEPSSGEGLCEQVSKCGMD